MNLLTKPMLYGLGAALLASLIFGGVQCSQKQEARQDAAEARRELAEDRERAAKALADFEARARAQEHRHAADMARIDQEHRERLSDAQEAADRVVAGLRAGNLRLQERWRGCGGSTDVPDTGAGSPELDAAARDREEGARDLVHAAAQCDAQVRGLQAVIRADRESPK